MANGKTKVPRPLATVRASVTRIQREGEKMIGQLRRDAETFVARSRTEVVKEFRDLERRALKALHAASAERVTRLERRLADLETMVAGLRKSAGERAA
jgi:hypothetical protein